MFFDTLLSYKQLLLLYEREKSNFRTLAPHLDQSVKSAQVCMQNT